jgi:uncharacterized protein (DUF1810 family)
VTSVVRFRRAQDSARDGFETALRELTAGRKRSHWIWYIFPQLDGLGRSAMAVEYGVRGVEEAAAYLRDDVLRQRLLQLTDIVAAHLARTPAPDLDLLMGSEIDAQKLVSSMTLFRAVAHRLHDAGPMPELAALEANADRILRAAAAQGYAECAFTLQQLAGGGA